MNLGIVTINPGFFNSVFKNGLIYKAIKNNILNVNFWDIKRYRGLKKKSIDGKIYGGGAGLLIKPKPLYLAINDARLYYGNSNLLVIYLSPQGEILNKDVILKLISYKSLIFVCGRYSGIDQRIIDKYIDLELSIGDYILSCGEISSMVVIDSLVRFIPGVLNNIESADNDSFDNKKCLLGFPNYTRPRIFNGLKVPKILLSGNHSNIYNWRLKKSLKKTLLKKAYLIKKKIIKK